MSANTTITATVTGELSGSVSVDLFSEYRRTLKINDADGLAAVVFLGVPARYESSVLRRPAGYTSSDGVDVYVEDSVVSAPVRVVACVRFPYVLCEAGGLVGAHYSYSASGLYDHKDVSTTNYYDGSTPPFIWDRSVDNKRMSSGQHPCADYCYVSDSDNLFRYVHNKRVYSGSVYSENEGIGGPRNIRIRVGRAVHPDLPYLVTGDTQISGDTEDGDVCTLVATSSRRGRLINGHRWTDEEFMQYYSSEFIAIREALEADPDYFPI